MTPLWLRGLAAPLLVVVLGGLLWLDRGPGAACVVVGGRVARASIALASVAAAGLTQWAAGPIDAPVPEGRGIWALAYAALYRRVRAAQRASARPAARAGSLRQRRGGASRRRRRPRRERSHPVGQSARAGAPRHRPAPGPRRADRQPRSPARIRPVHGGGRLSRAGGIPIDARRHVDAFGADRAVRRRGKAADEPGRHAAGGGRARAPRFHRQRVARTQDAADRTHRVSRDVCRCRRWTRSSGNAISR